MGIDYGLIQKYRSSMTNSKRTIYGLIITFAIFAISMPFGKLEMPFEFLYRSFATHSVMILLSIAAIYLMRNKLTFRISFVKVKTIIKPVVWGLATAVIMGIIVSVIFEVLEFGLEEHPIAAEMTPLQVFLFVFIYASICEEMLFRGFLLNFLKPLQSRSKTLLKIKISLPVFISAAVFGAAHLILLSSGVGVPFLIRIVLFTSALGLVAGYYQEKYDNFIYAVIVHMSGNTLAVLGSFAMN